MKLLYCEDCTDIIAPFPQPRKTRACRCGRHSVWWENPGTGELRLHDRLTAPEIIRARKYPGTPRAYVIGLTNALLHHQGQMSAEAVQGMIEGHRDHYLFKQWRSLVIRIRPGESSDTAWAAELPS
jgi:hypothetical protein